MVTKEVWVKRVDELLKTNGRTAQWLAIQIGTDPSHLNRVMRGHLPLSAKMKIRVAKELRVPFDWLFK